MAYTVQGVRPCTHRAKKRILGLSRSLCVCMDKAQAHRHHKSSTSRADLEREQQGKNWLWAACSSSVKYMSR